MIECIIVGVALLGVSPLVVGVAAGTYRLIQMIRDPVSHWEWHI